MKMLIITWGPSHERWVWENWENPPPNDHLLLPNAKGSSTKLRLKSG
jgi:hypothetical protein